ncbi:MAG: DNA-processing protein DprA [Spirochaetaceae bacterium]|jgi:DNA protecting protein DprA|nr:DNA-processing protein DprA [Spirochaetaceae bacterium]
MRGLLDLAIARLPVRARQKIQLCRALTAEDELRRLSAADFAAILCTPKPADGQTFLDFDESPAVVRTKECTRAWRSIADAVIAAEKDAAFLHRQGLSYVSVVDEAYPPLLKTIYDPPAVLFYRGSLDILSLPAAPEAAAAPVKPPPPFLAVVGTRKPCGGAMAWTYKTMRPLAAAGITIVSGLALGIDAQAHRGAVDEGGRSCAVLGTSIDNIYPRTNRPLAAKILENGGIIISEYPPLSEFAKWHFPERNRIISGLCPATIVVEAGKKSGALITADFALEQGRDVWVAVQPPAVTPSAPTQAALPPDEESPPDSPLSPAPAAFGAGCSRLLDEGARPVFTPADILPEFGLRPPAARPAAAFSKNALASGLARELGL